MRCRWRSPLSMKAGRGRQAVRLTGRWPRADAGGGDRAATGGGPAAFAPRGFGGRLRAEGAAAGGKVGSAGGREVEAKAGAPGRGRRGTAPPAAARLRPIGRLGRAPTGAGSAESWAGARAQIPGARSRAPLGPRGCRPREGGRPAETGRLRPPGGDRARPMDDAAVPSYRHGRVQDGRTRPRPRAHGRAGDGGWRDRRDRTEWRGLKSGSNF